MVVAHTEESQSIMSSHKGPFCPFSGPWGNLPGLGRVFGKEEETVRSREKTRREIIMIIVYRKVERKKRHVP